MMSESVFCAHQHIVYFFQKQRGRPTRGYDMYELLLIPLKGVKANNSLHSAPKYIKVSSHNCKTPIMSVIYLYIVDETSV